ncbi:hypothetical protein XELAEV_18003516mg [Xenopus laevis]|nr:hypothetical protein XELAEV_18003516mg [Xenopus laevis]
MLLNVFGWYMTPEKITKFDPKASPQTGSLLHIFWSYPKLQNMWIDINNFLKKLPVSLDTIPPGMVLFHLGTMDLPPQERLIMNHIFITTRNMIASNWKSLIIPKIDEIRKRVESNLLAEKSWAIRCGTLQSFLRRASLWPTIYTESTLLEF